MKKGQQQATHVTRKDNPYCRELDGEKYGLPEDTTLIVDAYEPRGNSAQNTGERGWLFLGAKIKEANLPDSSIFRVVEYKPMSLNPSTKKEITKDLQEIEDMTVYI